MRVDWVMAAIQYEAMKPVYEDAYIEMNREA